MKWYFLVIILLSPHMLFIGYLCFLFHDLPVHILCSHLPVGILFSCRLIETFINIIIDSQAIIRNNPERNFVQFPISNILCKQQCNITGKRLITVIHWSYLDFPSFAWTSVCVCALSRQCLWYVDIKLLISASVMRIDFLRFTFRVHLRSYMFLKHWEFWLNFCHHRLRPSHGAPSSWRPCDTQRAVSQDPCVPEQHPSFMLEWTIL